MRKIVVLVAAVLLAGCTSTQTEPQQTPVASDVIDDKVSQFCRDLADVLTREDPGDPEDSGERLAELGEVAAELGMRDDIAVAQILDECADELAAVTASPTPTG